uniref:Uncharacterized protein n=1 Tax=Arcella intermedia TaxID=1963864 RepID=A0A6B2LRE6_9EUKA
MQIWDTAGQERFRTIASPSYRRGAHGIVLVYDITNLESFVNIPKWLGEIDRFASDGVVILLVGNKCDMEMERKVMTQEAQQFAQVSNLLFCETSAKNSTNVEEAFSLLVSSIKDKHNC